MVRTSCRIPHILFVAGVSLALFVSLIAPARAIVPVSPGVNLDQLQAEITALQSTVNSQASTISSLQGTVTTLQNTVNSQAATIQSLQAKTASISVQNGVGTNTEIVFTGVNVHIVNGLGATDGNPADVFNDNNDAVVNHLGNLIIGYNARVGLPPGSHNLILGDGNEYSSYGGIIGGQFNTISGTYASVLSGQTNTASGNFSVVTGGLGNTASGEYSVVSGGNSSTASGTASIAVGGELGTASGGESVVVGGDGNTASGTDSIAP